MANKVFVNHHHIWFRSAFASLHSPHLSLAVSSLPCDFPQLFKLSPEASMFSQSHLLSLNPTFSSFSPFSSNPNSIPSLRLKLDSTRVTASISKLSNGGHTFPLGTAEQEIDRFAWIGNKVADAAGEVIRKYFRKKFDIIDKDDLSKSQAKF